MKWIVGVGIVIASPVIVAGIILWALVWKLPLTAYALAHEIYSLRTEKKHNGIGWYK